MFVFLCVMLDMRWYFVMWACVNKEEFKGGLFPMESILGLGSEVAGLRLDSVSAVHFAHLMALLIVSFTLNLMLRAHGVVC